MQELKGNIRVFCRVRPVGEDHVGMEQLDGLPLMQFPGTGAHDPPHACCPMPQSIQTADRLFSCCSTQTSHAAAAPHRCSPSLQQSSQL